MTRFKLSSCVITLPFGAARKRICKIVPLNDGGFSITPPAHKAESGVIMKIPHISAVGVTYIPATEVLPFTASDRVKLSYHADGFVQFSTAGSSPILSGRDENGIPRGIGVISSPLSMPINTRPSVGIGVWGLSDFMPWTPRKNEEVITIETEDLHSDVICPPSSKAGGIPGFELSFMVFTNDFFERNIGGYINNQRVNLVAGPQRIAPSREMPARLFHVSHLIGIAVLSKTTTFNFGCESGYQIAGPSDFKNHILAIYPPHIRIDRSLDYRPNDSGS